MPTLDIREVILVTLGLKEVLGASGRSLGASERSLGASGASARPLKISGILLISLGASL